MSQRAWSAAPAIRRIAEVVNGYLSQGPKERTAVVNLLLCESFISPTTVPDMRRQAEDFIDAIVADTSLGVREERGILSAAPVTTDQNHERRMAWAKCVERFHEIRRTGVTGVMSMFLALNDREAEFFVAELLLRVGYLAEAQVTARSRDGGVDVFGFRAGGSLRVQERYVVQVKWYNPGSSVSEAEVKHLYASDRTASRLLVTTAAFSKPAEKYAAENGVTLVGGEELVHAFLEEVLGGSPHGTAISAT